MKNIKSERKKFKSSLPKNFNFPTDSISLKLLKEYGAMYAAQNAVIVPDKVIFRDEAEVSKWQAAVAKSKIKIVGSDVELQTPAIKALKAAIKEAKKNDLQITPRGSDAARRSYTETVELWKSRVEPGLKFWTETGKLTEKKAEKINSLTAFEQVSEILRLEAKKIFFSKDLSKTIIYSVAPPGTSQHLSMLALDICEHDDERVREILAHNCWFQTVISDLPHFTYLGAEESNLESLGLKMIVDGERKFWIPNL